MMRRQVRIIVAIVALALLFGIGASITSGARPPAQDEGGYVPEREPAVSTGYHLAELTWQVTGMSGGGGYRLSGSTSPGQQGSGCCCTFLPGIFCNR
jgi:hypothetical protein